ncbi:MAG: NAD-dependent epimerase/dehydratase family protein [Bacteroidales bacterium]|nr:NAD-dependent epimerase/dehydratase family protein [Bacteroidales bacterium]
MGTDVAINFAAIVHQPKLKDEALYGRINHQLPVYLAKLSKEAGVRQFIQISTIAVYGKTENIGLQTPYNPTTPYGKTKLNADLELLSFQNAAFKVSLVRPSMVYGGGASPGNLMQLIKLAHKGIPLPFKGVNNTRQFCHINLLVHALQNIIEKEKEGIFLLADQKGISTSEILNTIQEGFGKIVPQIKPLDFFLWLLKKTRPSLYQKLYGSLVINVEPTFKELELGAHKYSLSQGIKQMVEAYKIQ